MALGRRALGQRLGLALAAWGLGDRLWAGWGATDLALAQPGRRRLALLIGIDAYPGGTEGMPPLRGCGLDVALQRKLLIHHFGFEPGDVLTLTDGVATRQNILAAIDRHLIAQAQPGDGVLFHFSGYGGVGRLPGDDRLWPTLVAVDNPGPTPGDILEAAIAARLRQLKSDRLTVILDAGGGGPQPQRVGAWRGRSRPGIVPIALLPGETPPNPPGNTPPWPGLLLRAGGEGYPAIEGDWGGFSAGVLTYALTQQSWVATDPSGRWGAVQAACRQWGAPRLPLTRQGGTDLQRQGYGPGPLSLAPAVALVDGETPGERGSLWLGA